MKSVVAPTVQFRDLSDILKKTGTTSIAEPANNESITHGSEVVEAPVPELAETMELEMESDATDEWEESAGLLGENVMPPA